MRADAALASSLSTADTIVRRTLPGQIGFAAGTMSNAELERAGEEAIARAMRVIRERHESGQVPDHMYYHNWAHTAGVIERAQAIGVAMGMSERDLLLTTVAAAFHDVVQRWVAIEHEGGVVMRQRLAGRDEVASAQEAVEAMQMLGVTFSPKERGIVASAILATIPGWDADSATVCQPFLVSHPVVSAVAIADLGSSGMDPAIYFRDGPALFAEENLDLMAAVMSADRASDIPPDRQDSYRSRYLAWLGVQPGFARGRRQRLETGELDEFAPEVRGRILALFSQFEESIALSEAAVRRARDLDFVALMRQLDQRAFPGEGEREAYSGA